ncbi:adenosylhomocysteinase, partial [Candidatus Acetothermia bacterium]
MKGEAELGFKKIAWARAHMPLNARIKERFERERPFAGHLIGAALHLEAKTANLILTLRAGGAEMYVIGSNPLSTQDEIAAALAETNGITVSARHGEPLEEHAASIDQLLDSSPTLIVEDGGEVIGRIVERGIDRLPRLIGICEETTTGVEQLRKLERKGKLPIPAIAVNDARMKYLLDNRYGTGQSTWDAIMRSTNLLIAGKTVLIIGYGWVGKGLALRACGLGARVIVTELDPIKSVEALMEGHEVASLNEGISQADIVLTATGKPGIVGKDALERAKDRAILANAGHFGYEIDKEALERTALENDEVRPGVRAYRFADGRTIYLLGEGELVNLAVADGHPAEIMDISFSLQALSLEHLAKSGKDLPARVHRVPEEIERSIA